MSFDFQTLADAIDYGFGTGFRPDYTVMAGAQLHVKTAPCIIDALTRFSQSGLYGWTDSDDPLYIRAVVNWMAKVRGWEIEPSWIVPSYGILQAMCASIRAFTQPGDGIIVQQPVYLLYARAIANCGRKLVDSPLQLRGDRYEMDFADLEEKMAAPENKLMLLCNPHNPTMDVWEREDLERVAALAQKHHVLVVADEIFAEHVVAPGLMDSLCRRSERVGPLYHLYQSWQGVQFYRYQPLQCDHPRCGHPEGLPHPAGCRSLWQPLSLHAGRGVGGLHR